MIEMPYEFHPEAGVEAQETGRWYADRDLDTADRFYLELAQTIEGITNLPYTWPPYLHGTRRYLMNRFPYSVIYREKDAVIQILAMAHHRRKPGYWSKRMD